MYYPAFASGSPEAGRPPATKRLEACSKQAEKTGTSPTESRKVK
jgi:hypothetical protein